MGTKLSHATRPGRVTLTSLERPLLALVRKLIIHANQVQRADQTSNRCRGESQDGVILEAEVDGVRCVLLRAHKPAAPVSLSPRELEIARMIAKGHPNKTIAAVLEISSWTVGTHLRRIFAKLGVTSRAAMVARIMELGALDQRNSG